MARPKLFSHRITVRISDAHLEHLRRLSDQSGLDRNEVIRRLIVRTEISSSDAFEGLCEIQRVQAEQNRLGGLLKLALRTPGNTGATRQALAEVTRATRELRALIGKLAERV
ncbi:MAG: ribbon-helix-helix protein, CopG family [Polyangiales bacterium]